MLATYTSWPEYSASVCRIAEKQERFRATSYVGLTLALYRQSIAFIQQMTSNHNLVQCSLINIATSTLGVTI